MRILCIVPHPTDGTSLYRAIGPLEALRRQHKHVELIINPDRMSWNTYKSFDVAFFQRPMAPIHLATIQTCKLHRKPVWIDYDDNLFEVPTCNRRYATYADPQVHHNMTTMLALADVVTTTTANLAEVLRRRLAAVKADPEKVVVIPNAYDPEVHPVLGDKGPRSNLIFWRGSDSHARDLWLATSALRTIIQSDAAQKWEFEFAGEPFWLTIEELNKVAKPGQLRVTPAQDPVHYFRYLEKRRPALVIVPLEDIPFNRGKSNIAWLESVCAGATVLAPAWPEWDRPGVISFLDMKNFESVLYDFIRGWERDWQGKDVAAVRQLELSKVNEKRMAVLEKLGVQCV